MVWTGSTKGRLVAVAAAVFAVGLVGCKKKDDAPKPKPKAPATDAKAAKAPTAKKPTAKPPADKQPASKPPDTTKPPAGIHYVTAKDGTCKANKKDAIAKTVTVYQVDQTTAGTPGKRTKLGCNPQPSDKGPGSPDVWLADKEPDGYARAAAKVEKATEKKHKEEGFVTLKQVWAVLGPQGKTVARVTTEGTRPGRVHLLTLSKRYIVAELDWGINLMPHRIRVFDTKTGKNVDLGEHGPVSLKGHLVVMSPAPNPSKPDAPSTCFDLKAFAKARAKSCPQDE